MQRSGSSHSRAAKLGSQRGRKERPLASRERCEFSRVDFLSRQSLNQRHIWTSGGLRGPPLSTWAFTIGPVLADQNVSEVVLVWLLSTLLTWRQVFMSATFQSSSVTLPPLGTDPLSPIKLLWKPLATSQRQWGPIAYILSTKRSRKSWWLITSYFNNEKVVWLCWSSGVGGGVLFVSQSVKTIWSRETIPVKSAGKTAGRELEVAFKPLPNIERAAQVKQLFLHFTYNK